MKATIITIGDEIVIGQITDTNSQYIASSLEAIGVNVEYILSVKDREEQIKSAVTKAMVDSQLVICTGGLGPTKDDITKGVFCSLFNCKLKKDEPSYNHVKQWVEKKGIEFNELNQQQAYLPEACTPIYNRCGTAPGMWFEKDGAILVSLPGVPFEMKTIVEGVLIPKIVERFTLPYNFHKTVLTYGIPESLLAVQIEKWEDALPSYLHLAYLPSAFGVRLRLSAYNAEKGVETEIDEQFAELKLVLKEAFIGYGEQKAAEALVATLLTQRGKTLSVAESCTGGRLASRFTSMAGSSAYFLASATTYCNSMKSKMLSVSEKTLEKYGAVSQEVAIEMAEGVRNVTGSDYALSTTGVAGPTGGSEQKPVGSVWIGFSSKEKSYAVRYTFGDIREVNIERGCSAAIDMLRKELM